MAHCSDASLVPDRVRFCQGHTRGMGTPGDGKLKVVTTLFPYYDFARQIAGDVVDLSMVIPAGQDSHSFEQRLQISD